MLNGVIIIFLGLLFFLFSNSKTLIAFLRKLAKLSMLTAIIAFPNWYSSEEKNKLTKIILRIFSIFLIIFGLTILVLDYTETI